MPGIYGSVPFVIGQPSSPKPVSSGLCVRCSRPAYRQTFRTKDKLWIWEHDACATKPMFERRRTRTGNALSYVPREYAPDKPTSFDPALATAIKQTQRT